MADPAIDAACPNPECVAKIEEAKTRYIEEHWDELIEIPLTDD